MGLVTRSAPFDPSRTPIETLPAEDQELWAWLGEQGASRAGGVIYLAFGSEVGRAGAGGSLTGLKAQCPSLFIQRSWERGCCSGGSNPVAYSFW